MMGVRTSASVPSFGGASKGVPFSRVVTVADSAFANITVTFPRSTKPISLVASISAGAGALQVQGLGQEFYAGAISPNVPLVLSLQGLPETTSIVVQVEQFAASTLSGAVFYN